MLLTPAVLNVFRKLTFRFSLPTSGPLFRKMVWLGVVGLCLVFWVAVIALLLYMF